MDGLGNPPSSPDETGTAQCTECGDEIRADVRKCSSCGSRQWFTHEAGALVVLSLPLYFISYGAVTMMGVSAAVDGVLAAFALTPPFISMMGWVKYRERSAALEAGGK